MADQFNIEVLLTGRNQFSGTADSVTNSLNRVRRTAQDTDDSMGRLERNVQRVRQALDLGIAGQMLGRVNAFTQEFNELGDQVRRAEETFVSLSGGTERAASGLETMRQATGGIVDNLTLMKSANQLFLTGLAETHEQAAELTEVAVRLGGALGRDAAESIENLNSALLNNSFVRLDTLGISAAAVRSRVQELTAAGMDMSAAFAQATMEEGREAIEALGDAAYAAETPLVRFQTDIENIAQQLASNFNVGLNAAINLLYAMADAAEDSAARTRRALEGARLLGRDPQPLTIFGYEFNLASGVTEQDLATGTHLMDFQAQQQAAIEQVFANTFQNSPVFQGIGSFGANAFGNLQEVASHFTSISGELTIISDLQQGLTPLFDSSVAAWDQIRSNVEQVAAAYSNMSLGEALGEGGSTQLISDINAQILQQVSERGLLDEAAFQAAVDTFNLASGEWTQATINMRDNVIPTLARLVETQGADVAAQRAAQVEEAIRRANAMGLDPNSLGFQIGTQIATGVVGGVDIQSVLEPLVEDWEAARERYLEYETAATGMEAALQPGEQALGRVLSTTQQFGDLLDTITKKKYNIEVTVDVRLTGQPEAAAFLQGQGFNPQSHVSPPGGTVTRAETDMRGRGTTGSRAITE